MSFFSPTVLTSPIGSHSVLGANPVFRGLNLIAQGICVPNLIQTPTVGDEFVGSMVPRVDPGLLAVGPVAWLIMGRLL